MATFVKEHSGILYDEDFNENSLLWTLSPSDEDCLRFEKDGLHILYSDQYISYTMKEPETSYCVITQLDHVPYNKEDNGGILLLANNQKYAECQTYMASEPSTIDNNGANLGLTKNFDSTYVRYSIDGKSVSPNTASSDENYVIPKNAQTIYNSEDNFTDIVYKYLKLIKINGKIKNTYQFLASCNGINWIEVGQTEFEQISRLGLFLYSSDGDTLTALQNNAKFVCNRWTIYDNTNITIKGINILQAFEITESDEKDNVRTVLRSDTTPGINITQQDNTVKINSNNILLPIRNGRIRIFPKGHYDITLGEFDMGKETFGGDVFSLNYDIRVFVDNKQVKRGEVFDIGKLYRNKYRRYIVISNFEDIPIANLKVSIVAYSDYYSGEKEVKIAIYDDSKKDQDPDQYTFTDTLTIPLIEAESDVELIMKLSDTPEQGFYTAADSYKFKILIE